MIAVAVALGLAAEIWFFPRYVSPITCVLYAIVVEAIRRLRAWAPGQRRSGLLLSRAAPMICTSIVLIVAAGRSLGLNPVTVSALELVAPPYGRQHRAALQKPLDQLPGGQLVIVRSYHGITTSTWNGFTTTPTSTPRKSCRAVR